MDLSDWARRAGRLEALHSLDEPGEVGLDKFEEYLRVFDKAYIAFAVAAAITLAPPAVYLWFGTKLIDVPHWALGQAASIDRVYSVLAFVGYIGWLTSLFVAMLYARRCAQAVGLSGYHWTFRWTFISLFVPFLNFVRPWLGFGEIRRSIVASHRDKTSGQAWHSETFSPSTLLLGVCVFSNILVSRIVSGPLNILTISDFIAASKILLAGDIVLLGYVGWYILSLRPLLIGLAKSRYPHTELPTQTASASVFSASEEVINTSEPSKKIASVTAPYGSSSDQVWQTFLEYEPSVGEAVKRLSSLSPKNVEKFRTLFLEQRDCSRIKEFEEETISRVQGPAFASDAILREAYIELNREDARLGDELVRVVGVIGQPKDLDRVIAQVRQKVVANNEVKKEQQTPNSTEPARRPDIRGRDSEPSLWAVLVIAFVQFSVLGAVATIVFLGNPPRFGGWANSIVAELGRQREQMDSAGRRPADQTWPVRPLQCDPAKVRSSTLVSSFSLSASRSATRARTERANAHLLSISSREMTLPITYGVLVSTLPGNSLEMCGYGRRSVLR
jgi:hypothetical protein